MFRRSNECFTPDETFLSAKKVGVQVSRSNDLGVEERNGTRRVNNFQLGWLQNIRGREHKSEGGTYEFD